MKLPDYFRPSPHFNALRENSKECIDQICQRMVSQCVPVWKGGERFLAWGQFLDESRPRQFGIYGTSAAVEVLSTYSAPERTALRSHGKAYLLWCYKNRNDLPDYAYDFSLIIKNCCFLNAFTQREVLSNAHLAEWCLERMEFLRNARLEDGSWGYYYRDQDCFDRQGRIIPTCYTLLALDQKKLSGTLGDFERSLDWLASRVQYSGQLIPYEFALILCTLQKLGYPTSGRKFKRAASHLRNELLHNSLAWAEKHIEYIAERPDAKESPFVNEYYVIKSGFIILDYLSAFDQPLLFHPRVLGRIEEMIRNTLETQGYKSESRIATRSNKRAHSFFTFWHQHLEQTGAVSASIALYWNILRSFFSVKSVAFSMILLIFILITPLGELNTADVSQALLLSIISGIIVEILFASY